MASKVPKTPEIQRTCNPGAFRGYGQRQVLQVVMIHDRDLKTFETGAAGGGQPRLELMKSQRRKNRIRQKAEMGSGNRFFLYPAITKL